MSATVLVDASIAIRRDGDVTSDGVAIERYAGAVDDSGLLRVAVERHARVLVVTGDGYLVADAVRDEASRQGVTLAVTHTTNPLEAADLVREHASALVDCERGVTVRLLSTGPEPIEHRPEVSPGATSSADSEMP